MCTALYVIFFFFKQKTAYEIPKRDWSSDVCSSDLRCSRWNDYSRSHVQGAGDVNRHLDGWLQVRDHAMSRMMEDNMGMGPEEPINMEDSERGDACPQATGDITLTYEEPWQSH